MNHQTVAIVGATGDLGSGLALRWAAAGIPVYLGSRSADRAMAAAKQLQERLPAAQVRAGTNWEAASAGDVVVLSVPFEAQEGIIRSIASACQGKVVLDVTVPLAPGDPTSPAPVAEGSAGQRAQKLLGEGVRVVAGLHTIAAALLSQLERPLAVDALLCGDDAGAKDVIARLVRLIGLRPIDCGPLANAQTLERLVPLIIGINKRYRRRDVGIRFTGLPDEGWIREE